MIIDGYLRFERDPSARSKSRLEMVSASMDLLPFIDPNKTGRSWIYFSENQNYIKAAPGREPRATITSRRGNHITSMFTPSIDQNQLGYGDINGSQDALLFILEIADGCIKAVVVLLAKGKKNVAYSLFQLLQDGELDQEINTLKKQTEEACK